MSIEAIRATCLDGAVHGFFGRRGGVSSGELAGLNVGFGSNDDRSAIDENRRRAIDALLPGAALTTVHQVHSAEVVHATKAWPLADRPRADAMVTDRPNLLLGILTADCAPVLLADTEAGVVGAAHAGWRGALSGVTDSTIAAMEHLGARRKKIRAAIGPCIAQVSYEVDQAFGNRFLKASSDNQRFFAIGAKGKPHFDLEAYVRSRLFAAGVEQIEALHLDTYGDEERFYSFRRATHRGEVDYGRQLSAIALKS